MSNYLYQTLNLLKSTRQRNQIMSDDLNNKQEEDEQNKYYKIPSKPFKETSKNQAIFTRSQCFDKNACGSDCLIHKKRKRRLKKLDDQLESSANLSDLSEEESSKFEETFSSTTSNNRIKKSSVSNRSSVSNKSSSSSRISSLNLSKESSSKESNRQINSKAATVNSTTNKLTMPRRKTQTRSNFVQSSDEDAMDTEEIVEINNIHRINYYEQFTNSLTGSNNPNSTTRSTTNCISIFQLIIFLLILISSIYYLPTITSHFYLNKQNYLNIDNETFLDIDKLTNLIDNIKYENNKRAINLLNELNNLKFEFQKLNERINKLELNLDDLNKQQQLNHQKLNQQQLNQQQQLNSNSQSLNCELNDIKKLIKESIDKYDADKTGLVDYASEFSGGEIVSTGCTETDDSKGASYKILGVPIWSPSNIPRFVIQPNSSPGQCWYFKGNKGSLVIKLSRLIKPESFSYEHISILNAPDGHINSAPRFIEVRGLDGPNADDNWLLGEFEYKKDGDTIQYFKFQNRLNRPIQYIEFNILDNHGNDEFTCLYRIRVHGVKIDLEE